MNAVPTYLRPRKPTQPVISRRSDLRPTAYHEAGHLAAAQALGIPIARVWINKALGGGCEPVGDWPTDERAILISLLGPMAERLSVTGRDGLMSAEDLQIADAAGAFPPEQRACVRKAEALLLQLAPEIHRLASRLLTHRTLYPQKPYP